MCDDTAKVAATFAVAILLGVSIVFRLQQAAQDTQNMTALPYMFLSSTTKQEIEMLALALPLHAMMLQSFGANNPAIMPSSHSLELELEEDDL